MASHRCGIYDVCAFAVFDHCWQERLTSIDHAPQVDVDRPPPPLHVINTGDSAPGANPGVVAQQMHIAESFVGGCFERLDLCKFAHIDIERLDGVSLGLEGLHRFGKRGWLDIGDHQIHTFGTETTRHSQPNATGGTCDDSGFTCELFHDNCLAV